MKKPSQAITQRAADNAQDAWNNVFGWWRKYEEAIDFTNGVKAQINQQINQQTVRRNLNDKLQEANLTTRRDLLVFKSARGHEIGRK